MAAPPPLHLAVALDGAGWHPAAWREPDARPSELFSPGYWVDLVVEAERGLLDFVTIEDSLALQSTRRRELDERTDQVRGRLDAVLVAARVAPRTSAIGIVPVATTTHTEPFHVSKSIATLDYVSNGRAGMQARVSATSFEARQFGRREINAAGPAPGTPGDATAVADLFDEAADFIEVVRRLWDSWEDDAEIRDVATGRFVDRDKLHYIDFEGKWFSVRGPSITPRPPQGQPPVSVLAHVPVAFALAARVQPTWSSSRRTPPRRPGTSSPRSGAMRRSNPARGRHCAFSPTSSSSSTTSAPRPAPARTASTSGTAASTAPTPSSTPAHPVSSPICCSTGAPPGSRGFGSGPGPSPTTSRPSRDGVVGVLQDRSTFRRHYEESTLRERLGLPRAINMYAGT